MTMEMFEHKVRTLMRMNSAAKLMRGGAWRARGLFSIKMRECDTMWMQIGFSICALLLAGDGDGDDSVRFTSEPHVQCARSDDHKWHWPRSFRIKLKSACRECIWYRALWARRETNDEIVRVIRRRKKHFNRFAVVDDEVDWTQRYRCDHISCRIVSFSICGHYDAGASSCTPAAKLFLASQKENIRRGRPAISAMYSMRMTQWHDVNDIVVYDRSFIEWAEQQQQQHRNKNKQKPIRKRCDNKNNTIYLPLILFEVKWTEENKKWCWSAICEGKQMNIY